jgi:hypothetical protein
LLILNLSLFCASPNRQHPWFQIDLPPYLQNPPEVLENEVNPDVHHRLTVLLC